MAGETFEFGPAGSGAFNNPALWLPSVGAPPRSGQDQNIVLTANELSAVGVEWADFDVTVVGNSSRLVLGGGQVLGRESSITQTAPNATYRIEPGGVNNLGEIDIGATGARATARFDIAPGAIFTNTGPMDIDGNLLVGGGGAFINNSTITLRHGTAQFQNIQPGNASSTVVIGEEGTLAFSGFFASTAVAFEAGENGRLLVNGPFSATTLRTIIDFDAGDTISFVGNASTVTWQQAPATGGAPTGTLIATGPTGANYNIPFVGTYAPGDFKATYNQDTNIATIETTRVIDNGGRGRPGDGVNNGVSTSTQPVLDLSEYGRLDASAVTPNGPNDITIRLHDQTIRGTALQRADFLDGALIFDATAPGGRWDLNEEAAQVARMYYTVLGRAPEFAGAYHWVENVMEGLNLSINQVAPEFYNSREFKARYGEGTGDTQFVTLLYQNILGRDPTGDPGLAFWLNSLAQGTPRPDIVVGISESKEHMAIRAPTIDEGIKFFDHPWL